MLGLRAGAARSRLHRTRNQLAGLLGAAAGAGTLETYASLTARPLFERFGFVIVERCAPVVRGVVMTNFKMRLARRCTPRSL